MFKTKSPPDARRVLYNLRDATYRALNAEEHEATKAAQNAIRLWETVKPQLQDIDILNKVEYSLKEMEQAIKEKDPNLIKIKARIGETNLQDAIKEMENKCKNKYGNKSLKMLFCFFYQLSDKFLTGMMVLILYVSTGKGKPSLKLPFVHLSRHLLCNSWLQAYMVLGNGIDIEQVFLCPFQPHPKNYF